MVEEKGLSVEAADRIGTFVTYNGTPRELWQQLTDESKFGDHADATAAMQELKLLFDFLDAMDTLK
jgi:histidyl-tRNA synthetase